MSTAAAQGTQASKPCTVSTDMATTPFAPPLHATARRRFKLLALLALCTVALWVSFSNAQLLSLTNSSVSVRWVTAQTGTQSITPQQAALALERLQANIPQNITGAAQASASADTAQSNQDSNLPALAFWRETQGEIASENRIATANIISVLGDTALCLPARVLAGSLPPAGDTAGCAVTQQLAWLLWGSTDVVGLSVTLTTSGQASTLTYRVRAVVQGSKPLLLCAASPESNPLLQPSTTVSTATNNFTALELSRLPSGDRKSALEALLQAANLPAPLQTSWTGTRATVARVLCFAPLLVATLFAVTSLWQLAWQRLARHRGLLLFVAALSVALALPFLLAQMPAWLIPARWSDGAFWSGLWNTLVQASNGTLSLVPFSQDILMRQAFLQVLASSGIAVWSVCRMQKNATDINIGGTAC